MASFRTSWNLRKPIEWSSLRLYFVLCPLMVGSSYSLLLGLARRPCTSELFRANLNVRMRFRRNRANTRISWIQGFTFCSIGFTAPLSTWNSRYQMGYIEYSIQGLGCHGLGRAPNFGSTPRKRRSKVQDKSGKKKKKTDFTAKGDTSNASSGIQHAFANLRTPGDRGCIN